MQSFPELSLIEAASISSFSVDVNQVELSSGASAHNNPCMKNLLNKTFQAISAAKLQITLQKSSYFV